MVDGVFVSLCGGLFVRNHSLAIELRHGLVRVSGAAGENARGQGKREDGKDGFDVFGVRFFLLFMRFRFR